MEQADRNRRGATFDQVAALYDEVRPGYPEALVERVLQLAGLSEPGRILEIGCGPAKATLPFARRGHRMVCLEPGAELAALARERTKAFPAVEIEESRFEDYDLPAEPFDLLIAAQSWHWVDPERGDTKAAQALRPDGLIALFWNRPLPAESALHEALAAVYRAEAPQLEKVVAVGGEAATREPIDERITQTKAFGPAQIENFPWRQEYGTEQYLKLMQTQSGHLLLPEASRQRLWDGLARAIEEAGGRIAVDYEAVLITARR